MLTLFNRQPLILMTFIQVNELEEIEERVPTFLAVGSFDGVHLGHQKLLQAMVEAAKAANVRTAVLTFFPHPKRVILDLQEPHYISTLAERVQFIAEQGIDLIITHPFNDEVRQMRAAHFMNRLCRYADLRQLWGGDFALGYKREGDIPFLRQLGQEKGYSVELVNGMVEWNGSLVSSSRIRHSLTAGDVEDVAGCLKRPFQLSGIIIKGNQRGRTIGFPTANIDVWDELLLPANGVYATLATVGGKQHLAATNVGVRPTVNGEQLTVEAHLLDFDADIYGELMQLAFIKRLRAEQKFSSLDALMEQINLDVATVRQTLSK